MMALKASLLVFFVLAAGSVSGQGYALISLPQYIACEARSECINSEDCSDHLACSGFICVDPCLDSCNKNNSECRVRKHVAYCTCKPGFSGDPFTGCTTPKPDDSHPSHPATPVTCWPPQSIRETKKRYQVLPELVNWYKAFVQCLNLGGRLAVVNNEEEKAMLIDVAKEASLTLNMNIDAIGFWLSATSYGSPGTFTWMSTGKNVSFTAWNDTQPDNYGGFEYCLHLVYKLYEWNDNYCLSSQYPVCEFYKDEEEIEA